MWGQKRDVHRLILHNWRGGGGFSKIHLSDYALRRWQALFWWCHRLTVNHTAPYHVKSSERRWVSGSRWITEPQASEKGTQIASIIVCWLKGDAWGDTPRATRRRGRELTSQCTKWPAPLLRGGVDERRACLRLFEHAYRRTYVWWCNLALGPLRVSLSSCSSPHTAWPPWKTDRLVTNDANWGDHMENNSSDFSLMEET